MEVFPLIWSDDVARLCTGAHECLGLAESWRAEGDDGRVEHAELVWPGGKISLNERRPEFTSIGPSGIGLRMDDQDMVANTHARAVRAGASITQALAEPPVAYSFTATDPDGNQWWVHAETGFLDELRTN